MNNGSVKILEATVSATDGNDYNFFYNGNASVNELVRHIIDESILECCDSFGDPTEKTLSFIKQNLIRVVVKKVDTKVKSEQPEQDETEVVIDSLNEVIDAFVNTFPNITGYVESESVDPVNTEAKTPPGSFNNGDYITIV